MHTLLLALLLATTPPAADPPPAELVLQGGRIVTMDPARPEAEALAECADVPLVTDGFVEEARGERIFAHKRTPAHFVQDGGNDPAMQHAGIALVLV